MRRSAGSLFRYFAVRLALIFPTAVAASLVMFIVMIVLPGDVTFTILSGSPHTEAMRTALRAELGLDDPWHVQYLRWLSGTATGKGQSLETKESIGSIVSRQFPVTALLTLYTILLSVVVSIPLGTIAAAKQNRFADYSIRVFSLAGLAVPGFWLGSIVILVLLKLFRWTPPIIYSGLFEDPIAHAQIVVWPVLLLAWQYSSHLVRVTRSSVADSMSKEFVMVARARGESERRILTRYALRNSMLPPITTLGLQFGSLLGGAIVLETIYGLPGIGRGLVHAALARDIPVVLSLATLVVVAYQLINVVVDGLYIAADPRVGISNRDPQ